MKTQISVQNHNNLMLFMQFFKIAAITLGGGLAMLPVMQKEFVEKRKLLSEDDMLDSIAIVQSLPGIIGLNMAIMIGYRIGRIRGALASAFGTAMPSFIAIILVATVFENIAGNETLNHAFRGIRTAVCALILVSSIKMARTMFKNERRFSIPVALAAFALLTFWNVNAIVVIIAGAIAGLIASLFRPSHGDAKENKS